MASPSDKDRKEQLLSMSREQLIDIILKQENSDDKRRFPAINDSSTDSKQPPLKKQKTLSNSKEKRTFDMNKYCQRHIAFKFAYLGTNYDGFVRQQNSKNTIEEHLFAAFIKTCLITDIDTCNYSRCGRTDKGVSSLGNVISLTVRSKSESPKDNIENELHYIHILNNVLPTDIRILSWCPVNINFNSRFQCKYRYYKYLFYKNGMDIIEMRKAAKLLIGTHDFRNFCKMDVVNVDNFVREIIDIRIEPMQECKEQNDALDDLDDLWCINVIGNGFLWHQIRFTMSVLFMIGKGNEDSDIINVLLDINKCNGKPQYMMASDLCLILYDCVFEQKDVDFSKHFKTQSIATFCVWHQIWRQKNIVCNVRKIFWNKCIDGIKQNENSNNNNELNAIYAELSQLDLPHSRKKNKRKRLVRHVPLMKRVKEPSYEQSLNTMANSKLEKYNKKQLKRQFFQNN